MHSAPPDAVHFASMTVPPKRMAKKAPGHPRHKVSAATRARVKELAERGMIQDDIAEVLQVTGPTLRKYYRSILRTAKALKVHQVAGTLLDLAENEGPDQFKALRMYLMCQGGWKEKEVVAHVHASADSAAGQSLLGLLGDAEEYKPTANDKRWQARLSTPSEN